MRRQSWAEGRGFGYVAASLSCLATFGAWGCQYDDSGWQLDQNSGATSSHGGSGGAVSRGGKGSAGTATELPAGGNGGELTGGAAGAPAGEPEPKIDSMDPSSGPYGTVVTIKGSGLGSASRPGFTLALGNQGEVTLTPKDDAVTSWTDGEIVFRFPFPAEGAVALEAPQGAAMAGEFQPTWHIAQEITQAPAASVLASISPLSGHIEMLFDTTPLSLIDVGPAGAVEHAVTADNIEPSSLRLYLNAGKNVEGVAVSKDAAPVLVELQNQSDDLVAKATTIKLSATEFVIAGGAQGASAWMRRTGGWYRARPGASGWAQDKGPIADPNADGPNRASGGTSDGSLMVAWSVDTGNFLDDNETAYMATLAPTATKFAAEMPASGTIDDYITGLTLTSSGDGLVVQACGSNVDPFGLSGTSHYCYDSLFAPSGAHIFSVPFDHEASAHAFTHERAVAAYCTSDATWMIRTDQDTEPMPDVPAGEPVLYPCPKAVALEVSGDGDYLPVVRWSGKTYLLERNPAAPAP